MQRFTLDETDCSGKLLRYFDYTFRSVYMSLSSLVFHKPKLTRIVRSIHIDLGQVRLSKVRREPRKLKLRSEGIEINEIKIFAPRASAPRSGARGRDGLGSPAQF